MAQVLAVPGDRRHGFDVRQQSFVHAFGRITGIAVTNQNDVLLCDYIKKQLLLFDVTPRQMPRMTVYQYLNQILHKYYQALSLTWPMTHRRWIYLCVLFLSKCIICLDLLLIHVYFMLLFSQGIFINYHFSVTLGKRRMYNLYV
jgi:hypothetical protein